MRRMAEPSVRRIARELYAETRELPLVCPHGHVDPALLAEDRAFEEPATLIVVPDHYIVRMLYSQGVPMEALGIPSRDGTPVDVLDALIAGVNIVELDPADTSVGYGGLPNADGVVQLDASVMHGPRKRAGAVGALEGVKTPSLVAKAVLEHTDHHLLVGRDAQTFARNMGFEILPDLNTPASRSRWLEW